MAGSPSDVPRSEPVEAGATETEERVHDRRTLRLGVGVTITFVIALLYDWTLAYLAPIFVAPMLQAPVGPSVRDAAKLFLATCGVSAACFFAARFSDVYPVLFLVGIFPALFWTFRFGLKGGSPLVMLVALAGLMLVPLVAETTVEITGDVARSFILNIGISLVVALLMYAVLPGVPGEPPPKQKPVLSEAESTRRSAILTVITGSYAVAYFSFDWTNVHTPIYIAVYCFSLDIARGSKAIKGILAANVAAGVLAMILYQVTRMTPYLPFVAVLMLTINLVLARMITSAAEWAPLAGFALSVLMILYGESLLPFADDGGSNFSDRFGELAMAAIWSMGAMYVLAAYFPSKEAEA